MSARIAVITASAPKYAARNRSRSTQEGERPLSIDETRKKIDSLDEAIVRLLDERAMAGREISRHKKTLGLPLRNPNRENEVIKRLLGLSNGSMPAHSLENIYRIIMAETLALQNDPPSCSGSCGGSTAGKRDVSATVAENVRVAPGFYRMRLKTPELSGLFKPGQFFQLRVGGWGDGLFLRRPFAPSDNTADGLTFFYAVVGAGTSRMTALRAGDKVKVLAPLGNSYRLPPPGGSALLLGGGCGAPSLAPLARALREADTKTVALLGARTSEVLLDQQTFSRVTDRLIIATDDGSHGCRGTVVDAFNRERESIGKVDRIYACGPVPMLRAAAKLADELGVECQVSLEERMACGFGACMGCVVPVRDGKVGMVFRRVCHEGPVFDAKDLAWEEMT